MVNWTKFDLADFEVSFNEEKLAATASRGLKCWKSSEMGSCRSATSGTRIAIDCWAERIREDPWNWLLLS